MPMYEYQCEKCGKDFDVLVKTMAESEKSQPCPHCQSKKTQRRQSVFGVATKTSGGGERPPGCCGCGSGGCPH